jgi:redox-sensitive bicupin YhaK (pirin superfamily)
VAWTLLVALAFDALPGGRGALPPEVRAVTGLDSRVLLEPDDGSTGPLLRVADDRLAPGTGYGRHLHRVVDVVAVVLAGSLRHAWGTEPVVAAGDVAVLRAGTGLEHDEVAGDDGTHVLQTYLRSARPGEPPRTRCTVPRTAGWPSTAPTRGCGRRRCPQGRA